MSKDLASGSRSGHKNNHVLKFATNETPNSPESEESGVPLIRRKSCCSKAAHDNLASGRSREASPEDRGLAQKKAMTGILATDDEVVSAILVKASRRKLTRPITSGQFKSVGYLLGDSDSSSEDDEAATSLEKEVVASSSLDEVLDGRHETSIVRVAKVTAPEANPKLFGVDTEDEARASNILEARGYLEEVQASMAEVSSAGGEDNARLGLDVGSDDEDMNTKDEAKGDALDYTSTLVQTKIDVKKKVVVEDLVRGGKY
ncbi:hypothetical protein ACFE04_006215 [Oxalis oulophora]